MTLTLADLFWRKCANPATSYATTSVGGAVGVTEITGATIGEVFFSTIPLDTGGGSLVCYNKVFATNESGSDDAIACVFWLLSCIDDTTGDDTISAQSTSADDDSDYKIRIIGFDAAGDPLQSELTLNGTSLVTTGATWNIITRIELRSVSSNSLTNANGDITIKFDSTEIAVLLTGAKSLTNEISWGPAATLDDTATTTNATTAPGGISFVKNRTSGTAFAAANGGVVTAGSGQGIWMKLLVAERSKMSSDCQHGMRFRANVS